ncbi:MAG: alpha/beta hydrolase [Aggregatilineales bacterium]
MQSIRRRFKWRYMPIVLLIVLMIGAAGFVLWANETGKLMPEVAVAMMSDDTVTVNRTDGWLEFIPTDADITTGYIMYPGGKVLPDAYAPLARDIAEDGYFVAIVYAPLNLAFFNIGAAAPVIEAYPEIESWAAGGHSLGGVAAASFANDNPDTIDGLVLMASQSFPGGTLNERDDIAVVSIYGTEDGLQSEADVEADATNLPDDTEFVVINGGNHAQFGWYGEQAGDNAATISRDAQQAQIVEATITLLMDIVSR